MACPCCTPPWSCTCTAPTSVTLTMTGPPSGTVFYNQPDLVTPCNGTYVLTRDIAYETSMNNAYAYYTLVPAGETPTSWGLTTNGWRDAATGAVYAIAWIVCYPGYPGGPSVGLGGFDFRMKPLANSSFNGSPYWYSANVSWPGSYNSNNTSWTSPVGKCNTAATGGSSSPLNWANSGASSSSISTYAQSGAVFAAINY